MHTIVLNNMNQGGTGEIYCSYCTNKQNERQNEATYHTLTKKKFAELKVWPSSTK